MTLLKNVNTHLVIIDAQNCFVQENESLFVPGANIDMKERLPSFIYNNIDMLTNITCAFDWHPQKHISFTSFWKNENGLHPPSFSKITLDDLEKNIWFPVDEKDIPKVEKYLQAFAISVFNEHGIRNTYGAELVAELQVAIKKWENHNHKKMQIIRKNTDAYTEQFSIFKAFTPNPNNNQFNQALIHELSQSMYIIWAGEASSHCVLHSVQDFVNHCSSKDISKNILLTDAMSPVIGFEEIANDFLQKMKQLGVQLVKTTDFA